MNTRLITTAAFLLTSLGLAFPAAGATLYFSDAGGPLTWDNGTLLNWATVPGGPYSALWSNGSVAHFEGTAGTVNLGADITSVNSIYFDVDGYSIGGTGASKTITLTGAGGNIQTGAGTDTITAILGGSVGLTKLGAGTLVLTNNETYSGITAINAGTLQIGNGGATGDMISGASKISIAAGATCMYNTSAASVSLPWGKLDGAGTFYYKGNNSPTNNTPYNSYASSVTAIPSSFTGKIVIEGARIDVGNSNALGNASLEVKANGQIGVFGGYTIPNAVTIAGQGWSELSNTNPTTCGALRLSQNCTWAGSISLSGDARITATNNTYNNRITGNINGNGYELEFGGSNGSNGDGNIYLAPTAGTNNFSKVKISSRTYVCLGNDNAFPAAAPATVTMNGGNIYLFGYAATFANLSGASGNIYGYASTANTLTLNNSVDTTCTAAIQDNGSGALGITKTGPGKLTLPGTANVFSGPISVDAGTLILTSSATATNVVNVAGAATYGGTGAIGTVTLANTGGLIGNPTGTGVLTAASVAYSGASGALGASNLTTDIPMLAITGDLTVPSGTGSITVNLGGAALPIGGPYKVASWGSTNASLSTFSLGSQPGRNAGTLSLNGAELEYTVTGTDSPYWTGANGNAWNLASTSPQNWKLQSSNVPTAFLAGDTVIFDARGASQPIVNIDAANVTPGSITVDSTTNYTFQSLAGYGIVNGCSLVKNNTGTLTITCPLSYTGSTTVNGGTLQIGNGADAGTLNPNTSSVTIAAGATLVYYTSTANASLPWNKLNGGGEFYYKGTNTPTNNTPYNSYAATVADIPYSFTGTIVLEGSRINPANNAALGGTTSIVVKPNGQFAVFASGTYTVPLMIEGQGWSEDSNTTANTHGAIRLGASGVDLAGDITLAGDARISLTNGASSTISGNIGGNHELEFNGINSTWGGTVLLSPTVGNTVAKLKINTAATVVAGNYSAFSATSPAALTMSGGKLDLNGYDGNFASISGASGTITNGSSMSNSVLIVGSDNTNTTCSAAITDGTYASVGVNKIGTGVTKLVGANNFSGPIGVDAGSLYVLTGSLMNSVNVTAGTSGAIFGGSGLINDATIYATGGILANPTGAGQLTVYSSVSYLGTGTLGANNLATTLPMLAINGALNTTGAANSITVNIGGSTLPVGGPYKVASYGSTTSTSAFKLGSQPGRSVGNLVVNNNEIDYIVSFADSPYWTGLKNNVWDTASSSPQNWKLVSNNAQTAFITGDTVIFDDRGSAQPTVDIKTADVAPGGMTFNNGTVNYTLQSSGGFGIAGSGGLVKSGAGKLTINTVNTFAGNVTVSGGTLSFGTIANKGAASALGAGNSVTVADAVLEYTGTTDAVTDRTVTFDSATYGGTAAVRVANGTATPNSLQILNPVAGANLGNFVKDGDGSLTIGDGANPATFICAAEVKGGSLVLLQGVDLYGNIKVDAGATVQFSNDHYYTGVLSGDGSVLKRDYGAGLVLTLAGSENNTFTGTFINRSGLTQLNMPGLVAIPGNIQMGAAGFATGWGNAGVVCMADNQTAASTTITWDSDIPDAMDFRVHGTLQTIGGLSYAGHAIYGFPGSYQYAIVENGGPNDIPSANGTLTVNVAAGKTYSFNGQFRDKDSASDTTKLNFVKGGTGTQVLAGSMINYTGTTTVNAGTLKLADTSTFASTTTLNNGATLELSSSLSSSWTLSTNVVSGTGSAVLLKSGPGTVTLTGANSYVGPTNITGGTLALQNANAIPTGSAVSLSGGSTLALKTLPGSKYSWVTDSAVVDAVWGPNNSNYVAAFAIDGDTATRWAGGTWLYADLGSVLPIGSVSIKWEASGNQTIAVSDDATNWTDVATGTYSFTTGIYTLPAGTTGRYVRATSPGYGSIYEITAFAAPVPLAVDIASLAGSDPTTSIDLGDAGNMLSIGGGNASSTFAGSIVGAGGLVKKGTGLLTLTGSLTYTGDTNVYAGTLTVGALEKSANVHVYSAGTLKANSIVADTLTIGGTPPTAAAVPEPASLLLLALAGLAIGAAYARRK